MRSSVLLPALALLLPSLLAAQTPSSRHTIAYVMPQGPGSITPPLNSDWQPDQLALLDNGTRLAVQFEDKRDDLVASYILFPNRTGAATSESCRASVLGPVVDNMRTNAVVTEEPHSTFTTRQGHKLAVGSYHLVKVGTTFLGQLNRLAFFGTPDTCFEVHLSKVNYQAADKPLFDEALANFNFDPTHIPDAADYGVVATLFFNFLHDYQAAVLYYQRAFDVLPKADITAPTATVLGRVTVLQLGISYGLVGDISRSRAVNQAAIARDPSFPMYYYELACADAEQGDAAAARTHLQQAFDRRRNMLPNLPMPDPTQDDSLLKLKNNADFWTFVQSLPKS